MDLYVWPFITYCKILFFTFMKLWRKELFAIYQEQSIFWLGACCGPPGLYWFWSKENRDSMKACLSCQTLAECISFLTQFSSVALQRVWFFDTPVCVVMMSAGGDSLMDSFTNGFVAVSIIRAVAKPCRRASGGRLGRKKRLVYIMNWRLKGASWNFS